MLILLILLIFFFSIFCVEFMWMISLLKKSFFLHRHVFSTLSARCLPFSMLINNNMLVLWIPSNRSFYNASWNCNWNRKVIVISPHQFSYFNCVSCSCLCVNLCECGYIHIGPHSSASMLTWRTLSSSISPQGRKPFLISLLDFAVIIVQREREYQ
jgi:hypothetical protein